MKTDDVPRSMIVGLNQSKKAIRNGAAQLVYLAADCDTAFAGTLSALCAEHGVPLDRSHTMTELGSMCGIDVGCAVCAYSR